MSDSITKWHEMQETRRLYPGDIFLKETKVEKTLPLTDVKKKAYRLLCEYDEEVIRMAMQIIKIGDSK